MVAAQDAEGTRSRRARVPPRPAGSGWLLRIGSIFGITSPRRAAVLAIMILALGLSVAVPLQNYVTLQRELAAVRAEQRMLADQVTELERRRALLEDPDHIEAQARERLRYVRPGETPYIVQLPPPPTAEPPAELAAPEPADPWYTRLWRSITADSG